MRGLAATGYLRADPGGGPPVGNRHQAWLRLRRTGVGASEIAAVLGLSPHATRFSLWWQKREMWDIEQNEAMEWGLRSEPMLVEKFRELHPEWTVYRPPYLVYRHQRRRFMLCSPDLFAEPRRGRLIPVELKTDEGGQWGAAGTDVVPIHHYLQVVWQCAVLGMPRGILCRYAHKRFTEYIIEVVNSPIDVPDLISHAYDFIQSIEDNQAPDYLDIDGLTATTDALTRLYPTPEESVYEYIPKELIEEFDRLRTDAKLAKQELARVKNQIRLILGTASEGLDSDGHAVFRRIISPRRGYTVAPTTVDKIERLD